MCLESKKIITEYSKVIVSTCGARFCQSPNLEHSCRTAGFSLCLQRLRRDISLYPFLGVQGLDSGHSIGHVSTHFDGLEAGSGLWTLAIPCAPRVVQKMLKYCCSPARQFFYASARGKSCYWSSLDWFSSIMMSWQFLAQTDGHFFLVTVGSCTRALSEWSNLIADSIHTARTPVVHLPWFRCVGGLNLQWCWSRRYFGFSKLPYPAASTQIIPASL
jgi:hypothetical protein